MKIPGIIAPPLTPFTQDLKVDYDRLRQGVDYLVEECGVTAVTAAGVETQEYHYLSYEERKELIRHTVEYTAGRCPVVVGVSHPSLRSAVELCHLAEELGAEAVQVLAPLRPFGGNPSPLEVIGYFQTIARETRLPIVAYHNPGPGAEVSPAVMVELAKLDSVRYFKESSRDLRRVSRLIQEIDVAGHAHYFTTMEMLLITLLLGGSGGTMPPPAAKIGTQIVRAYQEGDIMAAVEGQRKFALFPALWMSNGLAPVMKAAMKVVGVDAGEPYPPFRGLSERETRELAACLRSIDLA